jgi:uncharacterized protein (TIGR00369 family)
MSAAPPALHTELQRVIDQVFAPWVQALGLRLLDCQPGKVELGLPVSAPHVHAGGVLCGQTLMAAADSAMVLAITSQLGAFKPMTTVQLQTSFLRPVPGVLGCEVPITARVLRAGKSLVFGEVLMHTPSGALAAQATTTYMLLG